MIRLTEKEKKAFKIYSESLIKDPLTGIETGLLESYSYDEKHKEYEEFKQMAYELAKKILTKVAKKRGLEVDKNDSFGSNDIINAVGLEDFNTEFFEDYNFLKSYIESATKEMGVTELEKFHENFIGIGRTYDSIRVFMAKYIPKIIRNLYELSYEMEQKEIKNHQEENLSDEELLECIKFLNSYSKIMICKINGQKIVEELTELKKNKKTKDFYDNEEFMKEFEKIMTHDKEKHKYLFHGTQDLQSAESILNQGLGMMDEKLSSTTYSEFSMEQVILYSRGLLGEVGRDAIVIIDQPIDEEGKIENIVQDLEENKKINFMPSGLQGLDGRPHYIVDSRYIIGYVNKRDKKVIFNSRYYDYEKFMQEEKDETIISESDIGKSTIDVEIEKKDFAKKQIQQDLQKTQKKQKNK